MTPADGSLPVFAGTDTPPTDRPRTATLHTERSRLSPRALRNVLVAIDVAVSTASLVVGGMLANRLDEMPTAAVRLVAVVWLVGLPLVGLFQQRNASRPRVEASRGALLAMLSLVVLALAGRSVGVVSLRGGVIVVTTLLVGWLSARAVVRLVLGELRAAGHLQRPVVIATARQHLGDLIDLLQTPSQAGYQVVAAVPFDPDPDVDSVLDDVIDVIDRAGASGVVISPTGIEPETFHEIVHRLSPRGVHVEIQLPVRTLAEHRIKVTRLGRSFSLYLKPPRHSLAQRAAKRAMDVVVSAAALLVLLPLLLVVAVLIRATSPGPVFFVQRRVGRHGREFGMVKFRSMVRDAEHRRGELLDDNRAQGPLFKIPDDPRITPVGRWLRRTSLDEVPQLWNVLRGEMSLVGPRPALAEEMAMWPPELMERLDVAPGVTGMWQVYRSGSSYGADYARLDLHYVRNWTLANDLGLLLRTIPVMFASRGER